MQVDWRRALERVGLDPSVFTVDDLDHNRWLTPGIWSVRSRDRRMVLKCLTAERAAPSTRWEAHWSIGVDDPRHWNYWAREGLAYRDQLVGAFEPGGLVAPELVAADFGDDMVVLLLEYIDGLPGEDWSIAHYATAARSLGHAQGRLFVDGSVPSHEWLSLDFLRSYSSEKPVDWSLLDDDEAWRQPLVQRNFPTGLRDGAVWLHDTRERLYEIADRLPRVLCHLDFWTKNLIMRADGRVGLIDWAFVGHGAIGEDIGNLIPDAAFDHFIDAESLPELQRAVRDAYVDGLTLAGWTGDPRLVDLGLCSSAVKYDWLTPAMLASASAPRQLRYGGSEEIDGDYRFRQRGIALLDNIERAQRAVGLASDLGL